MSIGENIKKYRKEKGLTQVELAELVGVSKSTLLKYENDKVIPTPATATIISTVLEVSKEDVLGSYVDKRDANIILGKSGAGSNTAKISLPVTWLEDMGISTEDKAVTISYVDNKIIIEKS